MLPNTLINDDILHCIDQIEDDSIDLIIADPPYNLGKDYGNDSDKQNARDYLIWSERWITAIIPKLKETGSLYIFLTWQYAPEIFCLLKQKMVMINEIIWDRRVPSMGGTTRRFTSVHDNIGFFARDKKQYFFDLDAVRVPYDEKTKKKRTRSIFAGSKWLEVGYNPKDVWSVSRVHRQDSERWDHPTQKPLAIIERMIKSSCPEGGLVLDPFAGSGSTIEACLRQKRHYIGVEINPDYCQMMERRIEKTKQEL
jgi:site-specific DNA-methyltransferase (adenine-specific)